MTRTKGTVLASLLTGLVVLAPDSARADEDGPSGRDLVVAANTGFQWGIAPGIFVPTNGGSVGFSISGSAGYGVEVAPVLIVPSVALHAYFPSGGVILMPMGQGKVMYPIGGFAPYVLGGAGPAIDTRAGGTTALALEGGGGAIYYFSSRFALGAEATYTAAVDAPFSVFSVGPVLMIGF